MQAGTSIVRKAASRSVTVTSSFSEKVTSRSPSIAMAPAGTVSVVGVSKLIVSTRSTPTGSISPGAIGAISLNGAVSGLSKTTRRPNGAERLTGASRPTIDDMPIPPTSPKVTNSSLKPSTFQMAREPTKRSPTMATSTNAMSRVSLIATSRHLFPTKASATGTMPVAASPTARPVIVGSRISGKALLVPVETPAIGMSPHSDTTTRWVPSPPNTTMAATPISRIMRAAVALSAA